MNDDINYDINDDAYVLYTFYMMNNDPLKTPPFFYEYKILIHPYQRLYKTDIDHYLYEKNITKRLLCVNCCCNYALFPLYNPITCRYCFCYGPDTEWHKSGFCGCER